MAISNNKVKKKHDSPTLPKTKEIAIGYWTKQAKKYRQIAIICGIINVILGGLVLWLIQTKI